MKTNKSVEIMLSQIEKGKAIAIPSKLSVNGFFVILARDATDADREIALSIEEVKELLEQTE